MNFVFSMLNHTLLGQRSLEDVIGIIGHQLRALGHKAVWDPKNDKFLTRDRGYNVIVEGFTPQVVEVMAEYHAKGARFLCVATEEPTPEGFNHGVQKEMVARQEMFPEAARYIDGIMCLVSGAHVIEWYGRYAPSAYVELGYAPTLVRRPLPRQPRWEFGFYGSLSKRRLNILRRLARRVNSPNAVRVVADFATQAERDAAMQDAKVILQVRKFDKMGLVSNSRCNTALHLGRPVVAEPHELSAPWDGIVQFADSEEEFYSAALLARAAWTGLHAAQFSRFKERMTPEICVGEPLRRIGVLH